MSRLPSGENARAVTPVAASNPPKLANQATVSDLEQPGLVGRLERPERDAAAVGGDSQRQQPVGPHHERADVCQVGRAPQDPEPVPSRRHGVLAVRGEGHRAHPAGVRGHRRHVRAAGKRQDLELSVLNPPSASRSPVGEKATGLSLSVGEIVRVTLPTRSVTTTVLLVR